MLPVRATLRRDLWPPRERRMVRRLALSLGVLVSVIVAADAAILRDEPGRWGHVVLTAALVGAIAALLGLRQVSRARARWASFRLVVSDDAIRREMDGARPLEIPRAEAVRVAEGPAGILVAARGRQLGVPREVDGYERVRDALAAWGTGPRA